MPKIAGNKVAFYAEWGGRTDRKDGTVTFGLELSASEMSAAVFLWGTQGYLTMAVKVEETLYQVGICAFDRMVGKKGGECVIKFVSDLDSMKLSASDQMMFRERLLGVLVTASEVEDDLDEFDENENE